MPWEKDGSRKKSSFYKTSGFKMKGWSPFTKKNDHPKKKSPPEHKDLEVTDSSKIEKINDLEDRIEYLNSDISEESSVMKRGQMITQKNKLKNKLKQYKK